MSGCELPPCLLKRGEDIVVEIDFENCKSLMRLLVVNCYLFAISQQSIIDEVISFFKNPVQLLLQLIFPDTILGSP